jgi:hypothetical protein
MRLYLLAVSMIVLAGCADQAPKTPSGEVANASARPESGGAAPGAKAAQQRALEDFKDCAMRPTSVEQFTCLNELDRASRNSANE